MCVETFKSVANLVKNKYLYLLAITQKFWAPCLPSISGEEGGGKVRGRGEVENKS